MMGDKRNTGRRSRHSGYGITGIMVPALMLISSLLVSRLGPYLIILTEICVFLILSIFYIRPVYAYYDRTHVRLTQKSIEKICELAERQGIKYSCRNELKEYLGEPPWDGNLSSRQGLIWGSIAEDYLGDGGFPDVDDAIVRHHYYDPATHWGLSDFEGQEEVKIKGYRIGSYLLRFLAPDRESATFRASRWWEAALMAYNHGNIRDAYTYLGRGLHLLEDMACPSHTRNDNHLGNLKGEVLYMYNDHMYWDSLEQFCEGTHSPYINEMRYHPSTNEILKQFPFASTGASVPTSTRWSEPFNTYINPIQKPLSKDELQPREWCAGQVSDRFEFDSYLITMAENTAAKWWSDDTIPGNLTKPLYNPPSRDQGKGYFNETEASTRSSGGIIDVWEQLNLSQTDIENYAALEEWLKSKVSREIFDEAAMSAKRQGRGGINFALLYETEYFSKEDQDKLQPLRDSYDKLPFMWNMMPLAQSDRPWQLLKRRRYRFRVDYLISIITDRFPLVTEKCSALIQRFYDLVQHVEIKGDDEERTPGWRKKPMTMKANDPYYIWVENCGGIKDDFSLEIKGIPEGWNIEVESDRGCDSVNGTYSDGVWKGIVTGVEPTPKAVADEEGIKSPGWRSSASSVIKERYGKEYEGDRGAKLKVTVTPPKKEAKESEDI
jgi:hypothetical protein